MSEKANINSSSKLAKGIGGLTIVLGAALVVMAFFPVKHFLAGDKEWLKVLITLMMVTLMVIPGTLMIMGGYQFLREVNQSNLKALVGVYSAFGALWIFSMFSDRHSEMWHHRVAPGFFNLGMAVSGIVIYLIALRVLMPAFGMKWNGCRSVLAKGAFVLLAWLLWSALSSIGMELDRGNLEHHFGLIVLLGPISMAWGFYILAVNWLKAGQQETKNQQS